MPWRRLNRTVVIRNWNEKCGIGKGPLDSDLLTPENGGDLQLSDAELSFFWKLWLLFVFVPSVDGRVPEVGPDDIVEGVVEAEGELYVVNPCAVGGQ